MNVDKSMTQHELFYEYIVENYDSYTAFLLEPPSVQTAARKEFCVLSKTSANSLSSAEARFRQRWIEEEAIIISRAKKVSYDLQLRRLQGELRDSKSSLKHVIKELHDTQDTLNFHLALGERTASEAIPMKEANHDDAVCPIFLLSDIHVEEAIDPRVVNNLNEYNPEIAKQRTFNAVSNMIKQVRGYKGRFDITQLVFAMLGDNITGYIHDELKENNTMSPLEATAFAQELLISVIKHTVNELQEVREIVIPCTVGNHGRTTKKKRFATAYKNNYEYFMYKNIEAAFKQLSGYDNLKFVINESPITYIDIYGKSNMFGHGDHFNYGGGINGIYVPVAKWNYRMGEQEEKKADRRFIGHWHQYSVIHHHRTIINGSIIGLPPYGYEKGFSNSAPCQSLSLLHQKYGYIIEQKILCT